MYRIIKFKQGKGKTLARFHTEEDVAEYHQSNVHKVALSGGDEIKKHCVVEFERGTDNSKVLAEFDTQQQAAKYCQSIQENYTPFGDFFVQALELKPNGEYDDFNRKPQNQQKRKTWKQKK